MKKKITSLTYAEVRPDNENVAAFDHFYRSAGVCDDRGREIGFNVAKYIVYSWAKKRDLFACYVQVTRDQKDYGASQPAKYFTSEEDRDQWVDQALASRIKKLQ